LTASQTAVLHKQHIPACDRHKQLKRFTAVWLKLFCFDFVSIYFSFFSCGQFKTVGIWTVWIPAAKFYNTFSGNRKYRPTAKTTKEPAVYIYWSQSKRKPSEPYILQENHSVPPKTFVAQHRIVAWTAQLA